MCNCKGTVLTTSQCAALLAILGAAVPPAAVPEDAIKTIKTVLGDDAWVQFFTLKTLFGSEDTLKYVGRTAGIGKQFRLAKTLSTKEYFSGLSTAKVFLKEIPGLQLDSVGDCFESADAGTLCVVKVSEEVDWGAAVVDAVKEGLMATPQKKVAVILHPAHRPPMTVIHLDTIPGEVAERFLGLLGDFAHVHAEPTRKPTSGAELMQRYNIGVHLGRDGRSVADTIRVLNGPAVPTQVFISAPMMSAVNVKAADMEAARAHVVATGARVFVHAPYLINLAATPGERDDYGVVCLQKTVQAATAAGFLGAVVHVGKSVKLAKAVAVEHMWHNLQKAMESATVTCPILLETPAGQGTELLTTWDEFFGFVRRFGGDPRLRVCIDTCHVFAAGEDPIAYVERAIRECEPGLVRLLHFNDSKGAAGSCVDRHEFVGEGHIGLERMTAIAELATAAGIPCVFE
jgi:deoxyribonuclease-4